MLLRPRQRISSPKLSPHVKSNPSKCYFTSLIRSPRTLEVFVMMREAASREVTLLAAKSLVYTLTDPIYYRVVSG